MTQHCLHHQFDFWAHFIYQQELAEKAGLILVPEYMTGLNSPSALCNTRCMYRTEILLFSLSS